MKWEDAALCDWWWVMKPNVFTVALSRSVLTARATSAFQPMTRRVFQAKLQLLALLCPTRLTSCFLCAQLDWGVPTKRRLWHNRCETSCGGTKTLSLLWLLMIPAARKPGNLFMFKVTLQELWRRVAAHFFFRFFTLWVSLTSTRLPVSTCLSVREWKRDLHPEPELKPSCTEVQFLCRLETAGWSTS